MLSGGSGGIKKEEPGEYSGKTVPEKISKKYHRKHHVYFTDNIRGIKKEERKADKTVPQKVSLPPSERGSAEHKC